MRTIVFYLTLILVSLVMNHVVAQEWNEEKIEALKEQKIKITQQEKEALKLEVEEINRRLDNGNLTAEEARVLKENAAKLRALNIENKHAIIDNKIALLQRNQGAVLEEEKGFSIIDDGTGISINVDGKPWHVFEKNNKPPKYDRRTYSDPVIAVGFNNAIIDGQSLDDSPYKMGGSRFFEMGWVWRTRVFDNSNFMRFTYGLSFQFNGLKPKDNQYFVINDEGQAELQEFEFELRKSKFRMDNLVFPVHFEFGPSRFRQTENTIRYSVQNQFRLGIGGYGGFNLGTRQKLKYDRAGENVKDKLKRGYNTTNFVYGLSAYAGFDSVLLYIKYDLNPIFKDAIVEQRNISLGLRCDL
ncbi:porin family protein [Ulvibacterium marinum]|uniref:PorT family protein n=1 Tax=Ulvibacterium marinum TaxID=2419782 RepID=A0A3B0BY62_9FLAO|nr:PorT family protein [Ulvibacterium marinum]RKN78565.1 PorT family protein [Ulvibacterium marinum]